MGDCKEIPTLKVDQRCVLDRWLALELDERRINLAGAKQEMTLWESIEMRWDGWEAGCTHTLSSSEQSIG